jgi:hypothetical protein
MPPPPLVSIQHQPGPPAPGTPALSVASETETDGSTRLTDEELCDLVLSGRTDLKGALRQRVRRAMENPNRVTADMMNEWAKKGRARDSTMTAFLKHRGNLGGISMELLQERCKSSLMSDKFKWLTVASIAAELTQGDAARALCYANVARSSGKVRKNPNCPNIDSEDQFWVCVESSGTFEACP